MPVELLTELMSKGGLLALAVLGWFMFFKRDARVEALQEKCITLAVGSQAQTTALTTALQQVETLRQAIAARDRGAA